jgi:hypothetical protein
MVQATNIDHKISSIPLQQSENESVPQSPQDDNFKGNNS